MDPSPPPASPPAPPAPPPAESLAPAAVPSGQKSGTNKAIIASLILFLLAGGVLAVLFVRGGLPLNRWLGKEEEAAAPITEGLGVDIYESMSAEASGEAAAELPDTNPLSEVEADPYAEYVNPFE